MKKVIALSIGVMLAAVSICAQDIIITNDAQKIDAKILEVSKSEIKYKEKDNFDGPIFTLETKEISSIIYANGKVVLYNQQQKDEPRKEVTKAPADSTTIEESMAEVLLLSGQTITVQITDMKGDHIAYIQNGISYTLPASQIEKVTFLKNGQVREYNGRSVGKTVTLSPDEIDSAPKSGRIYRDNGEYIYNDIYISGKEVARILAKENQSAYNEWKKANGMLIGGAVCTGIGGGLAIGGIFPMIWGMYGTTLGLECSALVSLGVGLGLVLGASSHYSQAINIYNAQYDQTAFQFKWHVAPNEIGLAIAF